MIQRSHDQAAFVLVFGARNATNFLKSRAETGNMFKTLRRILVWLFLACLVGAVYYFWSNPDYHRRFVQKAAEVKEKIQEGDKKFRWSGPGVIAEVVDGDTVVANMESRPKVTLRLAAIDAPEVNALHPNKGQPLSQESKEYLAKMVLNRAVDIDIVGVDQISRPVVLLAEGGTNVNVKMLEAGLAESQEEFADRLPIRLKHALDNAELQAKEKHLGIWGLTNYVHPAEYRIRQNASGQ
jgi:endonuclease YncB( thermonuclease family)